MLYNVHTCLFHVSKTRHTSFRFKICNHTRYKFLNKNDSVVIPDFSPDPDADPTFQVVPEITQIFWSKRSDPDPEHKVPDANGFGSTAPSPNL